MMRCAYINLDQATARRAWMEEHFAQVAPRQFSLIRVPAVAARSDVDRQGLISPTEAACFRSHIKAIETCHDDGTHLLVLEDDVILSKRAFEIPTLAGERWDLLLLDAAIGDVRLWTELEAERARLAGRTRLLDLSPLNFASAAAYVINGRSKARVLDAIAQFGMQAPFDIALRRIVQAGGLRGCLAFPFATSIAAFSDETSQIRPPNKLDSISNTFRRRIFDGHGDGRTAAQLAQAALAELRPTPA